MCRRAFVSLVRRGTVTGMQVWPAQVLVGVALRGRGWGGVSAVLVGPQRGPDPPEVTGQQPSDEMWCAL